MATRIFSKVAGSSARQMNPFYCYGVVDGTDRDRKGRTWKNIKVYDCFKYPHPEFSTVRIYDIESAINSGEVIPINKVAGFYEFFFLKEDREKARNLIAELNASNQDIERNRNILRTMIDRSFDMRYNLLKEEGFIY